MTPHPQKSHISAYGQKQGNIAGFAALGFGILTFIWWVIGAIGNMQTAYGLFQIDGVTINWLFISCLIGVWAVMWLIHVNWGLLVSIVRARKEKAAAEEKEAKILEALALPDCRMPLAEAYDYILLDSAFGKALQVSPRDYGGPDPRYGQIENAVNDLFHDGKIRVSGIPAGDSLLKTVVPNHGLTIIATLYRDKSGINGAVIVTEFNIIAFNSILLDERDVRAQFPR